MFYIFLSVVGKVDLHVGYHIAVVSEVVVAIDHPQIGAPLHSVVGILPAHVRDEAAAVVGHVELGDELGFTTQRAAAAFFHHGDINSSYLHESFF